jgi:FdhD protein
MTLGLKSVDVVRVGAGLRTASADRTAEEEPLEVRLAGRPFAVIMRTPGADLELAAGFLLSEGVLAGADDLGTIEYCRDKTTNESPRAAGAPDQREQPNIVNVTLAGGAEAVDRALAGQRRVAMNSSCGLCGRLTIESLATNLPQLVVESRVAESTIVAMPSRLRASQAVFDATGGLHAAGLFTFSGALEASAEDVGRHNAVDKVVGRMLMMDRLPLSSFALFVSGRTSFEIVQKAFIAGIPVVAAVSAPSSLAVDLAREAGITLIGFVREGSFNIYSHSERVQ